MFVGDKSRTKNQKVKLVGNSELLTIFLTPFNI